MAEVLRTERLVVRELEPGDLEFVAEMLADPVTMRFWPRPYTREEAAQWIERHRSAYCDVGSGYWLCSLVDGVPVGQVGVLRHDTDELEDWGLGYVLDRPYWGRGYATEAARACMEWAFARHDPPRVVALIRPENLPSVAVAERLGMNRAERIDFSGFPHDVYEARRQ